jgi:hypothetical protein
VQNFDHLVLAGDNKSNTLGEPYIDAVRSMGPHVPY